MTQFALEGASGRRCATRGGAGSIVRANLSARRVYTYKGERRSVFSGSCPDGRVQARGTFFFSDGAQRRIRRAA